MSRLRRAPHPDPTSAAPTADEGSSPRGPRRSSTAGAGLLAVLVLVTTPALPAQAATTAVPLPPVVVTDPVVAVPLPTAPPAATPVPAPVVRRPAPATAAQKTALRQRVRTALGGSSARLLSAAVDVEGYGPLLRLSADRPMPPASTQKSFVGLSALLALGPDVRYSTEVVALQSPVAGELPGPLWLVGGGDPYLSKASLRRLAVSVREAGITTVVGGVRLDDLRYDARRTAAGWKPAFMPGQSGPLSALAVDANRWRRDAAFLADPALPAAVLFRDYLVAEGVTVLGGVVRERRPVDAWTVAAHEGGTLSSTVTRVLKASDNFAAEMLLKELGRGVRADGSSAGGLAAARGILHGQGVPMGAGSDGSGLSANDRQTPAGQVKLLQLAERSNVALAFRNALPLGCRDGTLRRRFCRTPAEGRVWAKTGTLSGVRALSGVTRTASGRQVQFTFQLSGVTSGARALAAIDRAVVVLASSRD